MDIEEILLKQRVFFAGGGTRDVRWRKIALRRLKAAVITFEDRINQAMWTDLHKSVHETYLTEISVVLQEINNCLKKLSGWAKPERVPTPLFLPGSKSRIVYEPLGLALVMAPWNYPFQLLINPLVAAIAAGNCVVLKPSPYASAVAKVVDEMIASVFEPEHVAVVQGDRAVNKKLLEQRFDFIFFTGSPELGKIVMQAAAVHLTPVILELGGKSPCIIDREADIDLAAKRLAWGKYLNAGQTCIAPDYLFVHQAVKEKLLERVKEYICSFYGEDPEQSPDYPRIISVEAVDRIEKLMQCGKVVAGGVVKREERYIAPTILDGVTPADPVMQNEIFGPVLPVMSFSSLDEVVGYVNGREKPLALYYFGPDSSARRILRETSSGGVCVNDTVMHIANPHLPFGGVGSSGMGKYHDYAGFEAFSNRRSVLWASRCLDTPFRYAPYTKTGVMKKIMSWWTGF